MPKSEVSSGFKGSKKLFFKEKSTEQKEKSTEFREKSTELKEKGTVSEKKVRQLSIKLLYFSCYC